MLKPVGIIRKFSGFKRETSVWSQQCRDSELNCSRLCGLKLNWPEAAMEKLLQVAPHSLALVLSQACTGDKEDSPSSSSLSPSPSSSSTPPAALSVKLQHHTGYEVFASFKSVNMQHFWNKALTHALSEMFFLGWIDECVLLIQGKEVHLQVLRNAWNRRTLKPPQGFNIKCIGGSFVVVVVVVSETQMHAEPCSYTQLWTCTGCLPYRVRLRLLLRIVISVCCFSLVFSFLCKGKGLACSMVQKTDPPKQTHPPVAEKHYSDI